VRALHAAACLLAPFALLLCEWRAETALEAAVCALALLPGVLLTSALFPPQHPFGRFPGQLGAAAVASLGLLGCATAPATRMHGSLWQVVAALAALGLVVCAASLRALRRDGAAAPPLAAGDGQPPRVETGRGAALLLLVLAGASAAAAALGEQSAGRSWAPWLAGGLAAGGVALLVASASRRRRARGTAPAECATRTSSPGHDPLATALWVGAALLAVLLMRAAYQEPSIDLDSVTYVGRAADFLAGGPLDRYEPTLGLPVPMDPLFDPGTVAMATALFARATGTSPAAQHHTLLPPLVVLAALGSLAALLGTLLGRDRRLLSLALLGALLAIAVSPGSHRSVAGLLIDRPLQPKSLHLLVVLPLQLASLLLVLRQPTRVHVGAAAAAALAGALVHPWALVVGGVWAGALTAWALASSRRALPALAALAAFTAALALLYAFSAQLGGAGGVAPRTPGWPLEMRPLELGWRLDPAQTLGRYALFRLGILALPWIALLGRTRPLLWAMLAVSLAALAFAYVDPLAGLLAHFVPHSLLWRTRWMLPAVANAALFAVAVWAAARAALAVRGPRDPRAVLAALLALTAVGSLGLAPGGGLPQLPGAPARLSKLEESTHRIAEVLGAADAAPFVLAPPPRPGRGGEALSVQLPQILPRVRLVESRRLVSEWFFGPDEARRRSRLLEDFYAGRMDETQLRALRDEFPFDWAVVDHGVGRPDRQAQALRQLGFRPGARFGSYELWRAPAASP
jgi:hypothetical protein